MNESLADIDKPKYSIEIKSRLGCLMYSFYFEDNPFGSLLLNPSQDQIIINDIQNVIDKWNAQYREERIKEEGIRRNVRGRNKVTKGY